METILFTGGCRSGKSSSARHWTEAHGDVRAYIATTRLSRIGDDREMQNRIARHRSTRGSSWISIEADDVCPNSPLDPIAAVQRAVQTAAHAAMFDCVTLWLTDWMYSVNPATQTLYSDDEILAQVDCFADYLKDAPLALALVTNEIGYGIVPEYPDGRRFRDLIGFANQKLAAACRHVTLCVCGVHLAIK